MVAAISIGRSVFISDKLQISPLPNSNTATTNPLDSASSNLKEETPSPEELAFITEVEHTIEATKAYNEAVNAFNANVSKYNEAVKLTSIANVDGLPSSLESLSVMSESFEDNAEVTRGAYGRKQISSDTTTVLDMAEQVITLVAATNKLFLNVDIKKVKQTQMDMLAYFKDTEPDVIKEIEEGKVLTDDLKEHILEAGKEFMKRVE